MIVTRPDPTTLPPKERQNLGMYYKVLAACSYCGSSSGIRDSRGNCACCGAPLKTASEKWDEKYGNVNILERYEQRT